MPTQNQRPDANHLNRTARILAVLSTASVPLTLTSWFSSMSFEFWIALFHTTSAIIFALLFHVYLATKHSRYSEQLGSARVHLLLHFVPYVFFVIYAYEIIFPWFNSALTILFFLFFLSGRITWRALEHLFPSTMLYSMFYRGNSAFMTSVPILYLASIVTPNLVKFVFIEKIALFYFTVHFLILGVSALKLESDLKGCPA